MDTWINESINQWIINQLYKKGCTGLRSGAHAPFVVTGPSFNEWINESIKQSTNCAKKVWQGRVHGPFEVTGPSFSAWMNEWMNESINQSIDQLHQKGLTG